jgi:hypothetical protein
MSRIIIGIAGIGLSVLTYNIGYNAGHSKIMADNADAHYQSLIKQVSVEATFPTKPVPRLYLENWAEGYYGQGQ